MLASKEKHHLCGEVSTLFCSHYKKEREKKHLDKGRALTLGLFPLCVYQRASDYHVDNKHFIVGLWHSHFEKSNHDTSGKYQVAES